MKSKQILDGKTSKDGKSQFEGVEKKRQHWFSQPCAPTPIKNVFNPNNVFLLLQKMW
jgi:hypothetical protein